MSKLDIAQIRQIVIASLGTDELSVEAQRAKLDALGARAALPEGVRVEAVEADGVEAEWLRPEEIEGERALIYFHGGGYNLGSLLSSRALIARIALVTRAPALSCAYRLAPEHPFPAALDDAIAAYRWLTRTAGLEPGNLAMLGTSAGAGLALAACSRIRDHEPELELPAALVGMSAWLDLGCNFDSLAQAKDPLCQREPVLKMAQAYLDGHDPKDPLVSPIHGQLDGLPPILLQAGTAEGLRDENQALAARAAVEGVDLRLTLYAEMIHAWHVFAPLLDEANAAISEIAAFVRARVGAP